MKKVLIILAILVGLFLLYKLTSYTEPSFEKVKLDKANSTVYNTTEQGFLDTIVYVGLDNLKIRDVIVIIKPLESGAQVEDGGTLKAHIIGYGKQYVIFTDALGRKESITVMSHELIHLQQYYTGRLLVKNKMITWQNNTLPLVDWINVSYNNRPWEQEAFQLQGPLRDSIITKLYQ